MKTSAHQFAAVDCEHGDMLLLRKQASDLKVIVFPRCDSFGVDLLDS
jgi:hypothetical protein